MNIAVDFQNNNFLTRILIGIVMGNDLVNVAVQNGLLNIFEANIPGFFQKLIFTGIPLKFFKFQRLTWLKNRLEYMQCIYIVNLKSIYQPVGSISIIKFRTSVNRFRQTPCFQIAKTTPEAHSPPRTKRT